jgi:hypothetical protein
MHPSDIPGCVEVIASHPVQGKWYGRAIEDLPAAWSRMLTCGIPNTSTVVEAILGARPKIVGVGVSAFVSDDFMRELKSAPSFWIGPELARRVRRGDSPVLTEKQIREANTRGGLNLAVWQGTICKEEMQTSEVGRGLMRAFVDVHQGYLLKEFVGQAESLGQLEGIRLSGGQVWNFAEGRYTDLPENAEEVLREHHLTGMTREIAMGRPGSWGVWAGMLFLYRQPRLGFSASEQRLLLSALDGGTDEELSHKLRLSLTTVKKTWRAIYDRVAAFNPDLILTNGSEEKSSHERGRAKKQRLIAYLREHLEELRPYSRKLLPQEPVRRQSYRTATDHS